MIRGDKEVGSGYDLLKKLAGLGLTQQQIADMLSLSERTLRNRLRDDERAADAYAAGRAEIAYGIAERHRTIALYGSERESRRACEFWLERRGRPPDQVARKIIRGIERGRRRILIGGDVWVADIASRIAPGWTGRMAGRVARRFGFW